LLSPNRTTPERWSAGRKNVCPQTFASGGSTESLQRQRGCEHLAGLGARAVQGFLADLEMQIGGGAAIDRLLAEYRARLTPQMLQAARGDRFPPSVRTVP
jgi:hypothetical protein